MGFACTSRMPSFNDQVLPLLPWLNELARILARGTSLAADDLVQDTLTKAWNGWPAEQPTVPWLRVIMRNCLIDHVRTAKVRRQLIEAWPDDASPCAQPQPMVYLSGEMRQALCQLPPAWLSVVIAFYFEGKLYSEISATLNLPIGTVMSSLHRARGVLREALARENAHGL